MVTDPDIEQHTQNLHNIHRQIVNQWERENHDLEGGEFVKGRKKEGRVKTSLDPKTGSQWLVFGGGQQQDRSGGVVDAFTGQYIYGHYTILVQLLCTLTILHKLDM